MASDKIIMSKEILNIEEVCEFLRIKRKTIYNLLKKGKLPAIKIGGQWRFSKQVLTEMFYNHSQGTRFDKNEQK